MAGDDSGLSQIMLNVTADHPPAFLAQTEDDGLHCENAVNYFMRLKAVKAPPAELPLEGSRDEIFGGGK